MPLPKNGRTSWPDFLELFERLRLDSERPGPVLLVEGERDRRSLRRLGIQGPIVLVHHGRTLSELAQELIRSGQRVIILTDWDAEGGHLAHRIREFLAPGVTPPDLDYRRRLAIVLKGEIVHVEGLASWARRMAERAGAPLDHFLTTEGS
jgi:5S rRNA maturation endonuclease (ribonuclease M5)